MRRFCLVMIATAGILLLTAEPTPTSTCTVPDPCESSASTAGGVLMVCPAGDGPTLASIGATISVTVVYCYYSEPLANMYYEDFWISSNVYNDPRLCGGHLSSNADASTDENGHTTMSGSVAAVGYFGDGVHVIAGASPIGYGQSWADPEVTCDDPLPLVLVSPDINADFVVDAVDLAMFAYEFPSPVGSADPRMDFNGDGQIGPIDLSMMAQHFLHECD